MFLGGVSVPFRGGGFSGLSPKGGSVRPFQTHGTDFYVFIQKDDSAKGLLRPYLEGRLGGGKVSFVFRVRRGEGTVSLLIWKDHLSDRAAFPSLFRRGGPSLIRRPKGCVSI